MTALTALNSFVDMIYRMLRYRQPTLVRIQSDDTSTKLFNKVVIEQSSPRPLSAVVQAQPSESQPISNRSAQVISKPTKLWHWAVGFDPLGFLVYFVAFPNENSQSDQVAVHVTLVGIIYNVQLQLSFPHFFLEHYVEFAQTRAYRSRNDLPLQKGRFREHRNGPRSASNRKEWHLP